ncbi:MAG: dolichyl-phosphate-mannose--protein mannosyltransferase [Bacteroides sp.]|nr:dolichyl-phosphate-mannose--protein mannosyltransferase [Bacteroides sp.]
MKTKYAFLLLLIVSSLTLLPFLGEALFYSKGEPREAIVAVSMLQSGNWILPVSNGDMIPYKPPFMAWCIALFSLPWGHVTEYLSRLPSALALIWLILWTYVFYVKKGGKGRALLTAFLLLTSFEVYRAGVACRVDMLLTFFTVGAIYSLYSYWRRGLKGVPLMAILMMSGACLTKGPVGVVIPCAVAGLFMLLKGERFWKVFGLLFIWAIAACVIPALWYVAAFNQGGEQFRELMLEENIGRMTGTMSYDSHLNPWYYNVITLVCGFLPYTLLLLFSLVALFRHYRLHKPADGLWNAIRAMEPETLLSAVASITIFVFYCIPASKRSVYLLPMYPFVAFLIAGYLQSLAKASKRTIKVYASVLSGLAIIVFGAFLFLQCGDFPYGMLKGKHALENSLYVTAMTQHFPWFRWILAEIPALVALLLIIKLRKLSGYGALAGSIALTVTLYWAFAGVFQPAILNTKSDKRIATALNELEPERNVYAYTQDYNTRFFGVDYYLNDRLKSIADAPEGAEGYMIITVDDGKTYLPENAGKYDFYLLKHFRTRSCDLRKEVLLLKFKPRTVD